MNSIELARPLTVYWDLPREASFSSDHDKICSEISALRPLQLHLLDRSPRLGEPCLGILKRFGIDPVAVILTATASALSVGVPDEARPHGIFVRIEDSRGLAAGWASVSELWHVPALGIAFVATPDNWRELPGVVRFCLESGVPALALPMHRFYDGAPLLLSRDEQTELQRVLGDIDCEGLHIAVHDPFLWRAFHPEIPFTGNGCQAGNTMVAIAPDGKIYPCPSLPYPLGSVADTPLISIATGTAKRDLRSSLAALPESCRGCCAQAGCRGGCRGRSFTLLKSLSAADPACVQG